MALRSTIASARGVWSETDKQRTPRHTRDTSCLPTVDRALTCTWTVQVRSCTHASVRTHYPAGRESDALSPARDSD